MSGRPWGPWRYAPPTRAQAGSDQGFASHVATHGTITVTRTWTGPGAPPARSYILESGVASGGGAQQTGADGSGTSDDGLGDPAVVSPDGHSRTSQGRHLKQVDSSSGTISLSVPISAGGDTPADTNGQVQGSSIAYGDFNWSFDGGGRAITISCPSVDTNPDGGSKYREPALTGPVITNQRQPDGTLRGDTALLPWNDYYSFSGSAVGSWSTGSDYHWFSSLSGYSDNGIWPNINNFTVPEYGSNLGKVDHIFISLYDAGDGAKATGNYFLHPHWQYEPTNWPEDSGSPYKVMGPDPEVPGWPAYPWTVATDQDGNTLSPLVGPQGSNAAFNFSGSKTEGGSVDGALGVGTDAVNLQFGGGYDWSKTTDSGITVNPTPALERGQQTWAVMRLSVNRHKGHLDIYGVHGYSGTGVWRKDDIVTTDYSYYQTYQSAGVTPFDPAQGWHPPGY